jgi:hypothetical protein
MPAMWACPEKNMIQTKSLRKEVNGKHSEANQMTIHSGLLYNLSGMAEGD